MARVFVNLIEIRRIYHNIEVIYYLFCVILTDKYLIFRQNGIFCYFAWQWTRIQKTVYRRVYCS